MGDIISFGLWIKRRRKALDLTQAELAQRVSCSLDLIEADARRPSHEIAALLATHLQLADDERGSFIKVTRAEFGTERLAKPAQSVVRGAFMPAQAMSSADTPGQRRPMPPTNLPTPPTALIGRAHEIEQTCALLGTPEARLVTLTGPGGIGKTHLGLQIAAQMIDDFPDGVYFVDLAPLRDSALVINAITLILEIKETGGQPLIAQLKRFLGDKRLLLLIDNFEHVLDAAPLLAELLATAPSLKLLVTSRERLRLRGEKEMVVPPLALPQMTDNGRPTTDDRHVDVVRGPSSAVTDYAAVQLFIQRACDARADFQLTDANSVAVVEICVRLDGLPLAIELAAARSKLFEPEALLERLRSPLALLTGGARDLPARQQTIRHTIEWSYQLLTDAEQTLFRRLGLFVGGCTLAAVEVVCGDRETGRQGDRARTSSLRVSSSPCLRVCVRWPCGTSGQKLTAAGRSPWSLHALYDAGDDSRIRFGALGSQRRSGTAALAARSLLCHARQGHFSISRPMAPSADSGSGS